MEVVAIIIGIAVLLVVLLGELTESVGSCPKCKTEKSMLDVGDEYVRTYKCKCCGHRM